MGDVLVHICMREDLERHPFDFSNDGSKTSESRGDHSQSRYQKSFTSEPFVSEAFENLNVLNVVDERG
jgi:hypothetical protein